MNDYEKSLKAANEQLMTCPFCGGNAKISDSLIHCGKQKYQPLCPDCDAELGYFDTLGEAVAAWNTRAAVPHEMSAREYERAIDRAFHSDDDAYGEWADAIDEGNKDKAVAIIEKWAREHPEERSEE